MEMILKVIIGLIVAAGALAFGGFIGTCFGVVFGLEGLSMAVCQCLVGGFMLAQFVNVLVED